MQEQPPQPAPTRGLGSPTAMEEASCVWSGPFIEDRGKGAENPTTDQVFAERRQGFEMGAGKAGKGVEAKSTEPPGRGFHVSAGGPT